MKRSLAALGFLFLSCCAAPLDNAALRPLTLRVVERHDAYVEADASGNPSWIGESGALASLVVAEGSVAGDAYRTAFDPVAQRHDSYVQADASLSEAKRGLYLNATAMIRDRLMLHGY